MIDGSSKYIGLDVHKETIAVSIAEANGGEVRYYGEIKNTPEAIRKLCDKIKPSNGGLFFCYESGPCGFRIHRQLIDLGWDCLVAATSMIPRKAGDRVKTDRRDSQMLARLLRAGELTGSWVPDDAQEAIRDLTRARQDIKCLERQSKQRLLAFLLRHGRRFDGRCHWTKAHYEWLSDQKFADFNQQIVFQEYFNTVKALNLRIEALDRQIRNVAADSVFKDVIQGLMSLRGINLLTAVTIISEIGDLRRFNSAPQLMAYLGLVPSEYSSGGTKSRGGITKTGNSHVRRVLIESAWTYRHPARKSKVIVQRAERTSEEVQEISWKAQLRLCGRYRSLEARGKIKVQTCTAIARELAGFIWAVGQACPAPQVS